MKLLFDALEKWATENSSEREISAFKDGFEAGVEAAKNACIDANLSNNHGDSVAQYMEEKYQNLY